MKLPLQAIDYTGRKIGRWNVNGFAGLRPLGYGGKNLTLWACKCDCGTERIVSSASLSGGRSKSCGCLSRDVTTQRNIRHGHSPRKGASKTYMAWENMLRRVNSTNTKDGPDYALRGITVCDRWANSFEAFLSDMGECPADRSLDRIDVNGNYEPDNCRWATALEQARNKRMVQRLGAGVRRNRKGDKWVAKLNLIDKRLHIGTFDTYEEAVAAREIAKQKYWNQPINK